MQLTNFVTLALASVAVAAPDFAIGSKQYSISAKDTAQLNQITKAVIDAASSWHTSVTAQPEYSSAWSELVEFQQTHSGVPEGVTATDSIIKYASTPTWYSAMPTGLKAYIEKNVKEQDELIASVIKKTTGDAARPIGMGMYVSGAFAALVGGVVMAL
ncbi:uncharacterized protein M421DRAFT_421979 [Didymella exigua CBS 183.55]|uniref:Uncharacterized protein n=1 Tax=Didymella exigua CBS 183.55 TaxID=1150837 RepID=A0A6A5RHZ8_9PLEO|nr:uncharacterized protein M421DRAFT_421979 [Didymella exigua CBS 183.55]KAF1927113.1 hypothetical protein M421DRAFT_421979 [Didymella exigua CBS 183.55]